MSGARCSFVALYRLRSGGGRTRRRRRCGANRNATAAIERVARTHASHVAAHGRHVAATCAAFAKEVRNAQECDRRSV
ncbi:hypothetical protein A8H35_16950 [Burkholderia thailandensis]|nr:hypothetical protein A8H35_16950 [Burkholderia thailandensis]